MKRIIKKILIILSNSGKKIKGNLNEGQLIGKIPIGLLFVNFIFQRILRINCEVDFSVNFTSKVTGIKNIKMKRDSNTIISFATSGGCYIQAINEIYLGANFLFAPGVKIISANHKLDGSSGHLQDEPIIIGDNVWLGANVVVLPGVEIGNNCVVGAGSVVTKSFPGENLIIAGVPARIITTKNVDNCSR